MSNEAVKSCQSNDFKLKDIPKDYLIPQSGGMPLIRFGGLMFLASQMGVFKCQTKDVTIPKSQEIIFECKGWIIPSKAYLESKGISENSPLMSMFSEPVITHGTTNPINLKEAMQKYNYVMAETRSIVRCLRILTECPYAAEDEVDFVKESIKDSTSTTSSPKEDKTSRGIMINFISEQVQPAVKSYIASYLKNNNANIVQNLTDVQLNELMNGCTDLSNE